jgi:hypothetical protein
MPVYHIDRLWSGPREPDYAAILEDRPVLVPLRRFKDRSSLRGRVAAARGPLLWLNALQSVLGCSRSDFGHGADSVARLGLCRLWRVTFAVHSEVNCPSSAHLEFILS